MKYKSLYEIVDCDNPYVDRRHLIAADDLYAHASNIPEVDLYGETEAPVSEKTVELEFNEDRDSDSDSDSETPVPKGKKTEAAEPGDAEAKPLAKGDSVGKHKYFTDGSGKRLRVRCVIVSDGEASDSDEEASPSKKTRRDTKKRRDKTVPNVRITSEFIPDGEEYVGK